MVHLPGKRNRRVPLVLSPDVKMAMDLLVSTRENSQIPKENPFFFSNGTECGYLSHWKVLRQQCVEANVERPELVTSTRLRKHISTVAQVT